MLRTSLYICGHCSFYTLLSYVSDKKTVPELQFDIPLSRNSKEFIIAARRTVDTDIKTTSDKTGRSAKVTGGTKVIDCKQRQDEKEKDVEMMMSLYGGDDTDRLVTQTYEAGCMNMMEGEGHHGNHQKVKVKVKHKNTDFRQRIKHLLNMSATAKGKVYQKKNNSLSVGLKTQTESKNDKENEVVLKQMTMHNVVENMKTSNSQTLENTEMHQMRDRKLIFPEEKCIKNEQNACKITSKDTIVKPRKKMTIIKRKCSEIFDEHASNSWTLDGQGPKVMKRDLSDRKMDLSDEKRGLSDRKTKVKRVSLFDALDGYG